MALFPGEDLVDVTTPDGRALKLPRSLAAQFPGLAQPAPISAPELPPPALDIGQGGRPIPPGRIAQDAPVTTEIAGTAPLGSAVPAFGAQDQADLATLSAPPARPAPAPVPKPAAPTKVTDRDLGKLGATGALNQQLSALDDASAAGRKQADVEAKTSIAIADAYHARNDELDAAAAKRAKDAEDWAKHVDTSTTEYQSAAKAYADHKVDTSIAHPILAAISVALGALGSAMKNESKNPALDMLMSQIDKSVQRQLADRDKLRDVAGMKKSAIDLVRTQASDATARYNLAMAGMTEKAARQVEELKERSTSDAVKANADALVADLRLKGAGYLEGAVGRKLELDKNNADRAQREMDSRRTAGIAYDKLKLDKDQFAWQKNKDQQTLDLEAHKIAGKGGVKDSETYQKFGVAGVANKDGSPFVAQGSIEGIEKLREKKAASTTIVGLLDTARRLRTGWTSDAGHSAEWQELQQIWSTAKAKGKDALGLGALSGDDYKILDGYLGAKDPTSFRDPTAGIERARKTVIVDLNNSLKAHGLEGDYDIPDVLANGGPKEQPGDAAGREVLLDPLRDMDAGRVSQELGYNPSSTGIQSQSDQASRFREAGGILPSQRSALDAWSTAIKSDDPKQRDRALEFLTKAANESRAPGVRAYASQLLTNSVSLPSTQESTGSATGRAVVRDDVYQPPPKTPVIRRDSAGNAR